MGGSRVLLFLLAASVAVVFAGVPGRGRAQEASRLDVIIGLGLPAVERGIIPDASRAPGSPEAARRRAVRAIPAVPDFVGEDGARYRRGRVIVKFRAGVSMPTRLSALSTASRSATIASRPEHGDFDVVQIDSNEDPAAIARELSKRTDVEYAQPSHRMHTQLVPNDTFYKQYQWNLPLIDLERGCDIQRPAGSSLQIALYWDCTNARSTIGQLTNNNIGTAGVAFNVRLMPINVIASVWDVAFG